MRDTLQAAYTPAPTRAVLRGPGPQPSSAGHAAADLRAATRYYEQHVIAWHALGRISEVRAAREAVASCRQMLGADPSRDSESLHHEQTADTSRGATKAGGTTQLRERNVNDAPVTSLTSR